MTRWHVNNQAFTRPIGHFLERFGHNLVVSPANKLRPDLIHEAHECRSGLFFLIQLLAAGEVSQYLLFLRVVELVQISQQSFELRIHL